MLDIKGDHRYETTISSLSKLMAKAGYTLSKNSALKGGANSPFLRNLSRQRTTAEYLLEYRFSSEHSKADQ